MQPPGSRCGLKPLGCEQTEHLIVKVDASGQVSEAFIAEQRSPTIDACILRDVRQWSFLPARECSGEPIAGEYTSAYGIICDEIGMPGTPAQSQEGTSGRTRG